MSVSSPTLAQQITQLELKRTVLRGLLQLVLTLEQLRQAIEAVMLSGASPMQLSLSDLRSIEVIRQRVAGHSNEQLRMAIESLDQLAADALQEVSLQALALADQPHASVAALAAFDPRVNMFNRNARTAIALRALLARRGELLPPARLNLPQEAIHARLQQVEAHEQRVRERVAQHILGMDEDLARMLANPACTTQQAAVFEAMRGSLADNLKHVRSGLCLSDLPMPIDTIDFEADVDADADADAHASGDTALLASLLAPGEAAGPVIAADQVSPAVAPAGSGRLFSRLKRWLNTPSHVAWRDLPDERDKPD